MSYADKTFPHIYNAGAIMFPCQSLINLHISIHSIMLWPLSWLDTSLKPSQRLASQHRLTVNQYLSHTECPGCLKRNFFFFLPSKMAVDELKTQSYTYCE